LAVLLLGENVFDDGRKGVKEVGEVYIDKHWEIAQQKAAQNI
jgi:hypothetical protein